MADEVKVDIQKLSQLPYYLNELAQGLADGRSRLEALAARSEKMFGSDKSLRKFKEQFDSALSSLTETFDELAQKAKGGGAGKIQDIVDNYDRTNKEAINLADQANRDMGNMTP